MLNIILYVYADLGVPSFGSCSNFSPSSNKKNCQLLLSFKIDGWFYQIIIYSFEYLGIFFMIDMYCLWVTSAIVLERKRQV
jgi:hypothetical protein